MTDDIVDLKLGPLTLAKMATNARTYTLPADLFEASSWATIENMTKRAGLDQYLDQVDAKTTRRLVALELAEAQRRARKVKPATPAPVLITLGPYTVPVPQDQWTRRPGGMTNAAEIRFPEIPADAQVQMVEEVRVGPHLVPLTSALTLSPCTTPIFPAGALTVCVE